MNMTVAMIVAAVVVSAERKANTAMGKVAQRVKIERGVRKIETKQVQAPVRKRANIQWEAKRTRDKADMTFEGRATGERVSNHEDHVSSNKLTAGPG